MLIFGQEIIQFQYWIMAYYLARSCCHQKQKVVQQNFDKLSAELLALILCSLGDINSPQTFFVHYDRKNTFHLMQFRSILSVQLAFSGSRNRPCNQDFLFIRVCGFLTILKSHQSNLLLFTTPFLVISVCPFFGSLYSKTSAVI